MESLPEGIWDRNLPRQSRDRTNEPGSAFMRNCRACFIPRSSQKYKSRIQFLRVRSVLGPQRFSSFGLTADEMIGTSIMRLGRELLESGAVNASIIFASLIHSSLNLVLHRHQVIVQFALG